jgi:hypothetical protein
VLEAVSQQRAVRQPGQWVVQRLVAHPLLAGQPRQRGRERVGDRAQEHQLLVG